MTNAPTTRQTHIIRLVGTNRDGDVLQDIWTDIERMDIVKSVTQTDQSPNFQGHQRKFRWMDDPTSDDFDPSGNPARKTDLVKVCSPDEDDVDDPDEWVEIHVIKSLHARGNTDSQGTVDRYHTWVDDDDPAVTTRVFEVRKISHYDTNIDDDAQAAFDADPTLTAFVVQGADYFRDDSTKDDEQFIDHEIITYLKHRGNDESNQRGDHRGRQTKLLNQYLIDESDAPDGTITGAGGINPPYRLDPYQNIVNINFGGLAVEFKDRSL